MRMPALLIPILVLAACGAPRAAESDGAPRPDTGDALVGEIRVVGSAPVNVQVVLQPESGRAVRIAGPLRGEIEQLAGARLAVRGPMGPSPDPMVSREVEVTGYDILSVDGRPVTVGTVEGRTAGWTLLRTASGELVHLAGAPESLRIGQKVWVQGPAARVVQSYGVLTQ